ncbi:hypothetical protein [Leptolyngbya sp. FACHB-261]|uniref:hypothetical protein n=1 Tax=Leptolyngbya sp. FACHB-261 TaxID=2692806 RepID=UPI001689A689|nr:hypothetical protein [Leptolyngbya sp. FACHB-261]MBD2101416.1 hypothetical protein [Leptolyngbya sp. FACHB-261]
MRLAVTNTAIYKARQPRRSWSLLSILKSVCQRLLNSLVDQDELKVWEDSDRDGNACWYVYDRRSERHLSFASEAEVRTWIEQRYYSNSY